MSTDVVDGIEYFNTVVVQPHRKLVTNQGRGYHVRCRYQTQEKTLTNDFNVRYDINDSCFLSRIPAGFLYKPFTLKQRNLNRGNYLITSAFIL